MKRFTLAAAVTTAIMSIGTAAQTIDYEQSKWSKDD